MRIWVRRLRCFAGDHDDLPAIGASGSIKFGCLACGSVRMMTFGGPVYIGRIDPAEIRAIAEREKEGE